ncbi:MAG: class I SAM-dependent methyltransferase, partial [bacterium]
APAPPHERLRGPTPQVPVTTADPATLRQLVAHRALWDRKPALRAVYRVWFQLVVDRLPQGSTVLEVGTGPGTFAEFVRAQRPDLRWIASDISPTPWVALAADAMRLPFAAARVDAVVGVDILHHLGSPAAFFTECARVLRPNGRLVFVEPWVTSLSFPVYRWLHPEGCTLGLDPWDPFRVAAGGRKAPLDGDAAAVWKLLRVTPPARWESLGFGAPRAELLNGFAYLMTLGFRGPSLLPMGLAPAALALDGALSPLTRLTALRAIVAWDRRPEGPARP